MEYKNFKNYNWVNNKEIKVKDKIKQISIIKNNPIGIKLNQ